MSTEKFDKHALAKIHEVESMIENALWDAVADEDHKKELTVYEEARQILESFSNLHPDVEKERCRVLSYCLMRIGDAMGWLGEDTESIERASEALKLAERSESEIQVARSHLALGTCLLNSGELPAAEEHWKKAILMAEEHPDDNDMQQVLGWTLIVRAHVLKGKSIYQQALEVLKMAESTLESIENYVGIGTANLLMANVYSELGDSKQAARCKEKGEKYREKARIERR